MIQAGIAGGGTMGMGIARVLAQSGFQVTVLDIHTEVLEKNFSLLKNQLQKEREKQKITQEELEAIQSRIRLTNDINDLSASLLVIEAVVENLNVKKEFFSSISSLVSRQTILATNTSSLSVTAISSSVQYPDRFLGIHFFNPAPLMPLVEIIPTASTSPEVLAKARTWIEGCGKITVVAKDTPGFIVNRVARPYYSEALRIADEGYADYATIDYAMKTMGGFRMGPFELMDLIGHDVNYVVTETVWTQHYYDSRFTPSLTQKRLLEAGHLGRKTGKGFYDYSKSLPQPDTNPEKSKIIFERILSMLINMAADTLFLGIASRDDIDLAVTKGVNYPKGLLKWADEWGIENVIRTLDKLRDEFGEERYRVCPLLRKMMKEKTSFYS
jgi:3-hydroxybutyryl-CoA dehydrogenase